MSKTQIIEVDDILSYLTMFKMIQSVICELLSELSG